MEPLAVHGFTQPNLKLQENILLKEGLLDIPELDEMTPPYLQSFSQFQENLALLERAFTGTSEIPSEATPFKTSSEPSISTTPQKEAAVLAQLSEPVLPDPDTHSKDASELRKEQPKNPKSHSSAVLENRSEPTKLDSDSVKNRVEGRVLSLREESHLSSSQASMKINESLSIDHKASMEEAPIQKALSHGQQRPHLTPSMVAYAGDLATPKEKSSYKPAENLAAVRSFSAHGKSPHSSFQGQLFTKGVLDSAAGQHLQRSIATAQQKQSSIEQKWPQAGLDQSQTRLPRLFFKTWLQRPLGFTRAETFLQDLAARTRLMMAGGERELLLKLRPADLGGLIIQIQDDEGGLRLKLLFEHGESAKLLAGQLDDLKQQINMAGLWLEDVEVLVDPEAFQEHEDQNDSDGDENEGGERFAEDLAVCLKRGGEPS